jgi:hypothetical protein
MSEPTPPVDDEISHILADPAGQDWFEKHLTDLRQDAYGQRILYQVLAIAFVAGFAAYVAGYLLRPTVTTEPFGFLADLLYTFGFALWTAALVAVLIDIIPNVKRRQIRRALEAYEVSRRASTKRQRRCRQG